jgi:LysM repeat protein
MSPRAQRRFGLRRTRPPAASSDPAAVREALRRELDRAEPDSAPRPPRRSSPWTVLAPVALLASVTVALWIAHAAGWLGGGRQAPPQTPGRRTPSPQPTRLIYRVRPGDTLGAIAARVNVSVQELERLNPGLRPARLRIGRTLRLR